MKGVILAGGKGTRLFPMTSVTNKHLVPVGNLPMIEYPLHTLLKMGINDICVVTGGEHFQDIAAYLSHMHPNLNFSYHYQREAGGIAQALYLVAPSVGNEKMAVILGDNVFNGDFSEPAERFKHSNLGSMVFLKEVQDPQRFGVPLIEDGKIVNTVEKPKSPPSNFAITGLYFYDSTVFDKISNLKPSARGEYEITDVINKYITEGGLNHHIIDGFWSDAGTIESRKKCSEFVNIGLEKEILKSLLENPHVAEILKRSFD